MMILAQMTKMARALFSVSLLLSGVFGLLGCEEDRNTSLLDSIDTTIPASSTAIFDPAAGNIPFPNNLLFTGTQDGSLNIPVVDASDISDPKVAMNSLDGFSTTAPITTTFDTAIDAATISGNVHLFLVSIDDVNANPAAPTFAVTGITRELVSFDGTSGEYVTSVSGGTTLVLSPLRPLAAKSGYLVVIEKGLKDTSGVSYSATLTYLLTKEQSPLHDADGNSLRGALGGGQAQALEPLRKLTSLVETNVTAFDSNITRTDIILSWSFSTQSVSDVLLAEKTREVTQAATMTFNALNPAVKTQLDTSLPVNNVDIYTGTIDIPYYLSTGVGALSGYWKGADGKHLSLLNGKNPVPTETSEEHTSELQSRLHLVCRPLLAKK